MAKIDRNKQSFSSHEVFTETQPNLVCGAAGGGLMVTISLSPSMPQIRAAYISLTTTLNYLHYLSLFLWYIRRRPRNRHCRCNLLWLLLLDCRWWPKLGWQHQAYTHAHIHVHIHTHEHTSTIVKIHKKPAVVRGFQRRCFYPFQRGQLNVKNRQKVCK